MNGATVKVYSKAKDGAKYLSKNFRVREFACSDGSDPVFVSPELVDVLQDIRDHFNAPVNITSSFRTASHNKSVGGSSQSQHMYGLAADFIVKGVAPKEVARYVRKIMPSKGGVGIYSTFTHVDVRKTKTDWKG